MAEELEFQGPPLNSGFRKREGRLAAHLVNILVLYIHFIYSFYVLAVSRLQISRDTPKPSDRGLTDSKIEPLILWITPAGTSSMPRTRQKVANPRLSMSVVLGKYLTSIGDRA